MKSIEQVREQLAKGEFEFSHHAFIRAVERNISDVEICEAGSEAEVIEDYPDDKYSPSCLLLGFTEAGRPLHIHVSLFGSVLVKIITLYEPENGEWIGYRQRR
jgi:hypothetical protein